MATSEAGSAAWPGRLLGGGSWVSVIVAAAMAFGEYAKSVFPDVPPMPLAIGVVWLVSLVQLTGVRHSSTFQLISTILKVALIVAFLIAGVVVGAPQPVSFAPSASDLSRV